MTATADVLIVEDDAAIRELFVTALREFAPQISVDVAIDGADAVRKLLAGCRPRLILTNVMMPNMDGRELLAWVRRERPGVRVVAISAGRHRGDFDDYLDKPLELDDLFRCVRRWLPAPPA